MIFKKNIFTRFLHKKTDSWWATTNVKNSIMSFLYVSDIFDWLKSKKVAHKVIINDWITQHCEDAEDLEGYKKNSSSYILAC